MLIDILNVTGQAMYPIMAQNNLLKSIEALKHTISQRSSRSSVSAAVFLPKDAATEMIDVNQLSCRNSPTAQNAEISFLDGRLRLTGSQDTSNCWIKMVSLAEDCQSCNVLLTVVDKGVVLRTIRRIAPGEELLMWFTENILAMMNMPFLTPANIQGQNRYVCHQCNVLFEYPNPLKVHLALRCDQLERSYLWNLLANEFDKVPAPTLSLSVISPPITGFKFQLTGSPQVSPRQTSPALVDAAHAEASPRHSPNSSTRIPPVADNLSARHSAFKPYLHPALQNNNAVPIYAPEVRNCSSRIVQSPYQIPSAQFPPELQAAQMETIVSNLGKSKQGHLCIYCGKVYSRKYGLKIHIRTHTGYKPLKCKYCLRPFGDPSNLNKHVRLHAEGDTPYKCELCGKVLVRRRDLERHIKSRHQEAAEQLELSDVSSDSMDVE